MTSEPLRAMQGQKVKLWLPTERGGARMAWKSLREFRGELAMGWLGQESICSNIHFIDVWNSHFMAVN